MKKLFLTIIIFAAVITASAQPKAINIFTDNNATRDASLSILVKSLDSGQTLLSYHANYVLAPASTMKLISTATALEVLGGDFHFPTYLETDAAVNTLNITNDTLVNGQSVSVRDGVLRGNLYVRGTGDPSLGSFKVGNRNFLAQWVAAIKKAGIRKIEGKIVADMTFLDATGFNPNWLYEDMGNYYAPGIYGIAYMDNTMNITLTSSAVGEIANVKATTPTYPNIKFDNHIICTDINYDDAFVHGLPLSNERYLVGRVPAKKGTFGIKGDIPNPGYLLAIHLRNALIQAGIEVVGNADYLIDNARSRQNANNAANRTCLYIHQSAPLREIVKETNIKSNNLYAEQLFRYLGAIQTQPGMIHHSVEFERNYWKNKNVSLETARIQDGCGLAPTDAVSAQQFVSLLTYMNTSANWGDFYASLPISGQTGTLSSFLQDSPLTGRVHAKSGTISNVKSYAGYIEMPDGEMLVFAVIVNNQTGKVRAVQNIIGRFLERVYDDYNKSKSESK